MSFVPVDAVIAFTFGLGVLAILAIVFGVVERRLPRSRLGSTVQGFFFGIGAILVMLEPVRFGNGIIVDGQHIILDGRAIIVGIAAAFAGWPAALVAAAMSAAYRFHLDVAGTSTGAAGILFTATMGLIWAWRFKPADRVGFGALAGLGAMLAPYTLTVFLRPQPHLWDAFTTVVPVFPLFGFIGAIVMGSLIERERRYIRRETYWMDSAHTDSLTGLPNRRWFLNAVATIIGKQRKDTIDALLIVDADHFKAVNDRYGHPAGDAALVRIGEILRASIRKGDRVCRLGGEEFAVFVADTTTETATRRADDLCRAVSSAAFTFDEKIVPLSVSIGAVVRTGFAEAPQAELFRTADAALYAAKKGGRNRAVVVSAAPTFAVAGVS